MNSFQGNTDFFGIRSKIIDVKLKKKNLGIMIVVI